MHLLDRLIFAARRIQREHTRRWLAARNADSPVAEAQCHAWPGRKRLRGPWKHVRFVVFDTETTGLDTANLARRVERGPGGRYDLDSLLARHDIPRTGGRHTALGDALLTARLVQKLLKCLAGRGVQTLADLALPAFGREHAV